MRRGSRTAPAHSTACPPERGDFADLGASAAVIDRDQGCLYPANLARRPLAGQAEGQDSASSLRIASSNAKRSSTICLFGERRIKLAKLACLRNPRASIQHPAGLDSVPVESAGGPCEQRIIVGGRQGTSPFWSRVSQRLFRLIKVCQFVRMRTFCRHLGAPSRAEAPSAADAGRAPSGKPRAWRLRQRHAAPIVRARVGWF
jgi:hypothetical protein